MADQKPKHKPQKKRTLEDVLKSLQDLIRNDLVTGQPLHPSWRESGQPKDRPQTTAAETDSFHQALSKLDQIIKEKIIEPTERAHETPPEPLLPDEEIEIEWDVGEPAADAGTGVGDIEAADLADLDGATARFEEIELQPLAPEAAPPAEMPVEPPSDATLEPAPEGPPAEAVPEEIRPAPIVEALEAAPILPPEEPPAELAGADASLGAEAPGEDTIDLSSAPVSTESLEGQREFNFPAPREELNAAPASPPESAASRAAVPEAGGESDAAAGAEAIEMAEPASPEDSITIDLSADGEAEAPNPAASAEQPEVAAVESNSGADAYTVEFTVQPKPPAPAAGSPTDVKTETAESARTASASAETASQPPDESAVNKRPTPSDSDDHDKTSPEQRDAAHGAPDTEPSIPVLKDVADLKTPPTPPLPGASQARDIAIRVIARLNIERRKSGEKPLDIKTIERLQQYLADALNKRALNKK